MELCQAIINHNQPVVEQLLSKEDKTGHLINFSSPALFRRTPLHLACEQNNEEVVRLLLRQPNIDVNQPNMAGATPFLTACVYATSSALMRLLTADPRTDLARPDNDGFTPVFWLAFTGKLHSLKILVASGRPFGPQRRVSLKIPGKVGAEEDLLYSPEEIAAKEGKPTVAKLLRLYRQHPLATVHEARLELEEQGAEVADLFVQVVLLVDGYLRLRRATRSHQPQPMKRELLVKGDQQVDEERARARRFFRIVEGLPMELQMIVCNLARGSARVRVRPADVESAVGFIGLLVNRGLYEAEGDIQ